jgi:hypothetical protein
MSTAAPGRARSFKRCCLSSGEFDGNERASYQR